ncbi:hypothetical protein NG799_03925 [Laspinema sp. D1]|uniref:Uncharacterized protein n=1 Tax=Laspinema palackyanum D2a TaxID=2953684 RepID=A0ABT2ML52_9CYAN|nr:hypothetical protein [Laspinema sp. D2a]
MAEAPHALKGGDRACMEAGETACFVRAVYPPIHCEVRSHVTRGPHPSPPLAKGRGPEVELEMRSHVTRGPHPNPPLAKGRGPEVYLKLR